jgi:hypothetical protein
MNEKEPKYDLTLLPLAQTKKITPRATGDEVFVDWVKCVVFAVFWAFGNPQTRNNRVSRARIQDYVSRHWGRGVWAASRAPAGALPGLCGRAGEFASVPRPQCHIRYSPRPGLTHQFVRGL